MEQERIKEILISLENSFEKLYNEKSGETPTIQDVMVIITTVQQEVGMSDMELLQILPILQKIAADMEQQNAQDSQD